MIIVKLNFKIFWLQRSNISVCFLLKLFKSLSEWDRVCFSKAKLLRCPSSQASKCMSLSIFEANWYHAIKITGVLTGINIVKESLEAFYSYTEYPLKRQYPVSFAEKSYKQVKFCFKILLFGSLSNLCNLFNKNFLHGNWRRKRRKVNCIESIAVEIVNLLIWIQTTARSTQTTLRLYF